MRKNWRQAKTNKQNEFLREKKEQHRDTRKCILYVRSVHINIGCAIVVCMYVCVSHYRINVYSYSLLEIIVKSLSSCASLPLLSKFIQVILLV